MFLIQNPVSDRDRMEVGFPKLNLVNLIRHMSERVDNINWYECLKRL